MECLPLGIWQEGRRPAECDVARVLDEKSEAQSREKSPSGVGEHTYIGQYFDSASSLSYLNARYYDGSRGPFMSVDPVFLGNPSQQKLDDPQSLNAYAYADDNPINKKDPTGLTIPVQALTWVSIFTGGRELRIKLEVD